MGPAAESRPAGMKCEAMWDEQAEMKLGGHVEPVDLHVTVGDDLAIVECYEVGSNRDAAGSSRAGAIRATNSFRKENGQWKMIGHHTDLLPYLAGASGTDGQSLSTVESERSGRSGRYRLDRRDRATKSC